MDGIWKSNSFTKWWCNSFTKEHTWYALTDRWLLAQKFRIPKIQFTDQLKLKKKEDQSVDASVLPRRGNKTLTGANVETKCGAETEGKFSQRLPHLGIHPIYSRQTWTLLQMTEVLADSSCLLRGSARAWQIQKWMLTVIHSTEHKVPSKDARERTQGVEGVCSPIGGKTIWTNQHPHSSLGLNH